MDNIKQRVNQIRHDLKRIAESYQLASSLLLNELDRLSDDVNELNEEMERLAKIVKKSDV